MISPCLNHLLLQEICQLPLERRKLCLQQFKDFKTSTIGILIKSQTLKMRNQQKLLLAISIQTTLSRHLPFKRNLHGHHLGLLVNFLTKRATVHLKEDKISIKVAEVSSQLMSEKLGKTAMKQTSSGKYHQLAYAHKLIPLSSLNHNIIKKMSQALYQEPRITLSLRQDPMPDKNHLPQRKWRKNYQQQIQTPRTSTTKKPTSTSLLMRRFELTRKLWTQITTKTLQVRIVQISNTTLGKISRLCESRHCPKKQILKTTLTMIGIDSVFPIYAMRIKIMNFFKIIDI